METCNIKNFNNEPKFNTWLNLWSKLH